MHLRKHRRCGASTVVEMAFIAPVLFFILFGLLIGGLGIFRYQQVAQLARDGSRWASVHGTQYAADTGNSAATSTDVYNDAISPNAAGLNLNKLTYSVSWNSTNSPFSVKTVSGSQQNVANTVSVTVNYQWIPEAFLGGITLSSTSVTVMSY
jgi:Flp pilus assembly protein TadG